MDGILFLCSLIGIGLLLWWVRQNDSADMRGRTHGWPFAMRESAGEAPARKAAGTAPPPAAPVPAPQRKRAAAARRAYRTPTPRWPS